MPIHNDFLFSFHSETDPSSKQWHAIHRYVEEANCAEIKHSWVVNEVPHGLSGNRDVEELDV